MNPKPTCLDSPMYPDGPTSPAPSKRPEDHGTASERIIPGPRQIPIQEYLPDGVIVLLRDLYSDSGEHPPASDEPATSAMRRNGCFPPQR